MFLLPFLLTPQSVTRLLLLALFCLVALPVAAEWMQGQTGRALPQLLSLTASAGLLWLVDKGFVVAWRIAVSMSILLGFVAFALSLLIGKWSLTLAGLMFIVLGLGLVGLPIVRAYLDERWAARGVVIPKEREE